MLKIIFTHVPIAFEILDCKIDLVFSIFNLFRSAAKFYLCAAAENLYKQAQTAGGSAPSAEGDASQPTGGKDGDVIDAEVVDDK